MNERDGVIESGGANLNESDNLTVDSDERVCKMITLSSSGKLSVGVLSKS